METLSQPGRAVCGSRIFSGLVTAIITVAFLALPSAAWSTSKEHVLYSFTGGSDGGSPQGALIFDRAGNLYGLATGGGASGNGAVFKLTPSSGHWTESVIYSFSGGDDGARPQAGLIFDQAGNLYGTTSSGGNKGCFNGCGTVFELTPAADGSWTESILYRFTGGVDGAMPTGRIVFDRDGNLYGTTQAGGVACDGNAGCGTVFELTPGSGGEWTETVLHAFTGGTADGELPWLAGVIFDHAGNLFGTTQLGGRYGIGTAYELISATGSQWKIRVLHSFRGASDGSNPAAGLVLFNEHSFYGTTYGGGTCFDSVGCGTVFELTQHSDGSWTKTIIHRFHGSDGIGPTFALILDATGNLYGTVFDGGSGPCGVCGTAFELTPAADGSWSETVIHDFGSHPGDAGTPEGGLILDKAGNLFGTSDVGGSSGNGTVYEIIP